MWYNTVTLGAAAVSIQGPGSLFPAIQGNYSVGLQTTFPDAQLTAAIGQTGLIPLDSRSLIFLTGPASFLEVSFAGQHIPFVQIGAGPNYVVRAGDISQFAGQTGELRFTGVAAGGGIPGGGGILDDIRFSDQAIPEPRVVCLMTIGAGLLCCLSRKTRTG